MSIRLLEPKFLERVWGTTQLSPLFPNQTGQIGEVWFDAGPAFPLLIKFIFTSQPLSVQVHPDNDYAARVEKSRGKTEMWHIISAQPGATIALGFREDFSPEVIKDAIANARLEDLLNFVPVKAGDTYFVEAGTVHAIGAGITLCEIQQNSDVTYRLYDYGRDRELHVDKGMDVSSTGPYQGRRDYPVACEHFDVDLLEVGEKTDCVAGCDGALIVLDGEGTFDGTAVRAGSVALITRDGETTIPVDPHSALKLLHAKCAQSN